MGNKQSSQKITARDRAILDLKVQRDKLRQYQKKIQTILDREVEIAKEHLKNGDERRALIALKKKKYQEQLLARTDEQLLNVEQLTQTIETALIEKQVFEGLKKGNDVLTQIHNEMSVEDVEKLMDDTAEAIAYQNEIDELLSGRISAEDEEEVMKELDEILAQEAASKVGEMPAIPTKSLPEIENPVE
ncbi:Vacuolar protein sorting-associated protein 20, partial [Quaeritorhiza haematococci]